MAPAKATPDSTQRSILGFFKPKDGGPAIAKLPLARTKKDVPSSSSNLTPQASSDVIEPPSSPAAITNKSQISSSKTLTVQPSTGRSSLPSPVTPAAVSAPSASASSSPAPSTSATSRRRSAAPATYAESDDEDDDEPVRLGGRRRLTKRARLDDSDSSDAFDASQAQLEDPSDDDIVDFVVPDESDEEPKAATKKRKRPSTQARASHRSSPLETSPAPAAADDGRDSASSFNLDDLPTGPTATKWIYDPENPQRLTQKAADKPRAENCGWINGKKPREKVAHREPEDRYPWLANILDGDRNPAGHPDYDPRTIYVPPYAWKKFSPFETQYWEIKKNLWDTVVFFKKGKFYELYENDATIGHQQFDLKLTDRVNMRLVGVPEATLPTWAAQFVAKGFKIARVDQKETALGKEMREREDGKPAGKAAKEEKVIRRELACILTAGTLVEESMLQDDMSTYCVAIKEEKTADDLPEFGIAMVDTATGHFYLANFTDDVDLTRFETFVAQTRPQELLLEKGCTSVRALRILKNNTGPTTIWNYLKPGKEFWSADTTGRELDAASFFEEGEPDVLQHARKESTVLSAFGALVQYLRVLKIERELISLGNFSWYDPIKKATTLVLDGQTLINLEVFANSFDGTSTGTLFALLNRCVTPFGKRLFKQWVCHPLADVDRINARLDAVDSLNADPTVCKAFMNQLTRLPDLERLISRIHAGGCRAQDFLRVVEGFEQIDYTLKDIAKFGGGDGVIGKLISSAPKLDSALAKWTTAFDREKVKTDNTLVPERGVEEEFDESSDRIDDLVNKLNEMLKKYRRELGSNAIEYCDVGKEIYQLEVPVKVKGVPKDWDQMSATQKVKRYYSPELRQLVKLLQEAQETHNQVSKQVASHLFARFDEDYTVWLSAVNTIAQLDCLISLARASASLGEPSCRPQFVDTERSVIDFEELRHPCMLPNVGDFIPNDINLGGTEGNISLLTGANAAGKSTVLRMTCVAVIMAHIGCYVPARKATLTPVDRIMSRLGANDNIFAAQSTFFVELSETKKILSEATSRSLVILDELGRGTSSYDGVAVAQAVLHHIASHSGCLGFFATHYRSLAGEFATHPEIVPCRMAIEVDDEARRVTFLYRLERGIADGSFGMHCASMCGISSRIIERAEVAARDWEVTGREKAKLEGTELTAGRVALGWCSDVAAALRGDLDERGISMLMKAVELF